MCFFAARSAGLARLWLGKGVFLTKRTTRACPVRANPPFFASFEFRELPCEYWVQERVSVR
jgi:hypothetical protein